MSKTCAPQTQLTDRQPSPRRCQPPWRTPDPRLRGRAGRSPRSSIPTSSSSLRSRPRWRSRGSGVGEHCSGLGASPGSGRAERNIGHLPESLPRIEQVIEPESTQCPCGCGEMVRIGEDRTERLASFRRLQVIARSGRSAAASARKASPRPRRRRTCGRLPSEARSPIARFEVRRPLSSSVKRSMPARGSIFTVRRVGKPRSIFARWSIGWPST